MTYTTKLSTILLSTILILSLLQLSLLYMIYKGLPKPQTQPQDNPHNVYSIQTTNWRNDCGKPLDGYDGLFVYMTTCPFSNRMKPLVEKSNLKWYWVDVTSPECRSLNFSKFNFAGFVPHFYCLKSGNFHVGAMTEEQFLNWTKTNC